MPFWSTCSNVLRRFTCFLLLCLCVPAQAGSTMSSAASVLLVWDPQQPDSLLDAAGIREALVEQQIPRVEFQRTAGQTLTAELLNSYSAVLLAHVDVTPAEVAVLDAWVQAGGGLVASGRSGIGLETLLGLGSVEAQPRARASEIRFAVEHPVSLGSYWSGVISQTPPTPASEIPATVQLLYLDQRWPAFRATAEGADILARWRFHQDSWFTADAQPAVLAHRRGLGRTVYSGALLGAYADPAWQYPLAWRTVIDAALSWVNRHGRSVQLGYWPDAHRAAFAFTADAERAAMARVVPVLLEIFRRLGLQRFGTFFIVGQAGGDPGTEGALEHPQTVARILDAGAEVAGHGDVHSRFAGQGLVTQAQRMQAMRGLIDPMLAGRGETLLGFRAPGLAADRDTFTALADNGFAYDSSEQDVWSEWTLPYFVRDIWHLPATAPMDFAVLESARLSGGEWETLIRDKLEYVVRRRGLFNWVTHPWIIEPHAARIDAFLTDVAAREDLWLRRLDDIVFWWMQREQLDVRVLESNALRLRLEVANRGGSAVHGASLWLRQAPTSQIWLAEVDGTGLPLVARNHGGAAGDDFQVAVIPAIPAGGSVVMTWFLARGETVFVNGFEAASVAAR